VALRCLIVDDNVAFLGVARELLDGQGLDVVGVATTVEEALARAAELRPDVILADVYLANESGFDLASRFRQVGGESGAAVILISTYAERDLADLISASPAIGFLAKGELSGGAVRAALGLTDSQ
jgi:CheY-like chemotaxis protein